MDCPPLQGCCGISTLAAYRLAIGFWERNSARLGMRAIRPAWRARASGSAERRPSKDHASAPALSLVANPRPPYADRCALHADDHPRLRDCCRWPRNDPGWRLELRYVGNSGRAGSPFRALRIAIAMGSRGFRNGRSCAGEGAKGPVCKEIWRGSYSSRATDPVRICNDLDASPFSHFEEQEVRQ
jgi:hypothetical protein